MLNDEALVDRYLEIQAEMLSGPMAAEALHARLDIAEDLVGAWLDEGYVEELREEIDFRVTTLLDVAPMVDVCPIEVE